ncbi:MAG: hypothetical protein Q8Q09_29750 [Deltaproteobacteria bacterium]|nr:hypothetical protein [Deltaproteobacteria bacterium]
MAKKKKSPNLTTDDAVSDEIESGKTQPESIKDVGRRNVIVAATLAAISFGAIGFVLWHRPKDPGRVWLARVESVHRARLDPMLVRCFGGTSAGVVRAKLPEIRGGTVPPPMRTCRGTSLSEVIAQSSALESELSAPPAYAENARNRLRDSYERLNVSLRTWERSTIGATVENPAIPEGSRDRVASALDELATEIDAVQNALRDLHGVVEENASWY